MEIKSERRNLTFSPGSGEPAVPHEKAVETTKELVRLAEIAEMENVLENAFDEDYKAGFDPCAHLAAEALYEAGYRKQVESAWRDSDRNGVRIKGYMVCPACDVMIPTCDDGRYCLPRLHFCPNCGAKMKGGAE